MTNTEVRILWGDNTIHLSNLTDVDRFTVGETVDCNFYVPASKLGVQRLPLITSSDGEVTVSIPGRWKTRLSRGELRSLTVSSETDQLITLNPGDAIETSIGDFTFKVSTTRDEQVKKLGTLSLAGIGFHALSFATHAALLYLCAFSTPTLEDTDDVSLREERRILMSQYLNAAAEKENEKQQETKQDATGSTGQEGSSAKGSEGAMGNPTSKPANLRHAVKGPSDNVDPHLARQAAVREAANFGIIGLLNAGVGGDPNAPTSPWGRDESSGRDALSANGKLWGDAIGDAFGINGLTLSGIGEGGGGPGEGIGIGKEGPGGLGRRGPGGDGIGDGGRRLKDDHTAKTIRMRSGTTTSSGRIPPEIIQRIIRQNFGRFKMCYERGLRGDPNLSGRVAVRFTIGRDGSVTQVANGGSDIPNGEVTSCVVNSFRGLSFPAPESGIVTVGYSISLSPSLQLVVYICFMQSYNRWQQLAGLLTESEIPANNSLNLTGLAVVIGENYGNPAVTVYDKDLALETFKKRGFIHNALPLIRGYVSIKKKPKNPCWGASEIAHVAGPGKLVYGIAYALSPNGMLISDRDGMTASDIDAWYGMSSKNTRPRKKLDDITNPVTPEPIDDCEFLPQDFLNYAYESEGWERPTLESLKQANDDFFKSVKDNFEEFFKPVTNPGWEKTQTWKFDDFRKDLERRLVKKGWDFFDQATQDAF